MTDNEELALEVEELNEAIERWRTENNELRDQRNGAVTLLGLLVDHEDGPCDIDHNGYCQGHNLSRPCTIAAARQFLATARSAS